jgi:hypothetical protein
MDESYAEVGTEVILGRPKNNAPGYWVRTMEPYVGGKATIISVHLGLCSVCYVDADMGRYYWRVEDMILASDVPLLTPGQKAKMRIKDG